MDKNDILKHGFFGDHRWLSNYHIHDFEYEGRTFSSVEAFFQASKTTHLGDVMRISKMGPADAKRAGQKVDLREDWEDIKLSIMALGLELKFPGGDDLSQALLDTGDEELVEHNWWHDKFWGKHFGEGENHLGNYL